MFVPGGAAQLGRDFLGRRRRSGHVHPDPQVLHRQPEHAGPAIDAALARGRNLILTPGVYDLKAPILVTRPDTVVLGLGFATLVPQNGTAAMLVLADPGVKLSGMIFDAGPRNSPVLLQVGSPFGHTAGDPADPTLVQDVFFRIGGATAGQATNSLVVNSSNVILDDIWAWRADHGAGVGWTSNVADTGLIVNGNDVTAYGLFVEHYQKTQVIWNGQGGTDIFFQNEMPYDPPSQAAWMDGANDGYPAFEVTGNVKSFHGYGHGQLLLLQPGRAHLRNGGLPGSRHSWRRASRHPHPVPQRVGWHQLRGQRDRRTGEPGPARSQRRGELPLTSRGRRRRRRRRPRGQTRAGYRQMAAATPPGA